MAGLHELELAAAPTTVLESEGIEREEGEGTRSWASRWGCCGKRLGPRAVMGGGRRARGELCSSKDREKLGLEKVVEGVGVLTVEVIQPRRPSGGDRQRRSWLCLWSRDRN